MHSEFVTYRINITGIVQGVGFRPFVYHLATRFGITGWVRNTSSGVEIAASAEKTELDQFLYSIENNPPVLAQVDEIHYKLVAPEQYSNFEIQESHANPGDFIPISPDMSICPDCRRELFDPKNRRYRYPFINCTNCGPRFSIIKDIPYDRPLTTMAEFRMCPDCEKEYHSPTDRRYHAQPIACRVCGPQISYVESGKPQHSTGAALSAARSLIREGKILAIKGIGGYHLACDALNSEAVQLLHERKNRSEKPFALMCFDLETMRRYVQISAAEALLLESPQHPIVLLEKKPGITSLDHTATRQNHLGFMLPYTPLHLLMLEPETGFPDVLVMTSGNLSEEPIAFTDTDALTRLIPLVDAFLIHDRPIHMRVDDAVTRVVGDRVYPIRRARGYAPEPVKMAIPLPQVFSCGAELKSTFAFSRGQYIFLSHHIGDLENIETLNSYEQAVDHYKKLFRLSPEAIAVDLHPDYLSTRYGERQSLESGLPLNRIQHHHAHLAAVLADNNYQEDEPVIGLIFDGTGYGQNGVTWGGEILVGGYRSYQRAYHLAEVLLPGGDTAIRNPSRIALSYLRSAGIEWSSDLPPVRVYQPNELATLSSQLAHEINCPLMTSMGRLFDAVASLLGVRQQVTYEGQAAIELENICDPSITEAYAIPVADENLMATAIFPQVVMDIRNSVPNSTISARFHNAVAALCLEVCTKLKKSDHLKKVALSGGVWQNTTLLRKTLTLLKNESFEVLIHRRVPTNDGGIALGQTLITASMLHQK